MDVNCLCCVQGYQRLEFLGDAVLDLLMTRYYFTTYRSPQPSHPTLSTSRSNVWTSIANAMSAACQQCDCDAYNDTGSWKNALLHFIRYMFSHCKASESQQSEQGRSWCSCGFSHNIHCLLALSEPGRPCCYSVPVLHVKLKWQFVQ